MATKVEALSKRKGRPSEHNWDKLLDGSIWRLKKGEDYTSQSRSFVSQARRAAQDAGLELDTRTIESEFLREDADNPKSKFKRDAKGEKVKDGTVIEIVAYNPDTHEIVDGQVVEREVEADADDEDTTDE